MRIPRRWGRRPAVTLADMAGANTPAIVEARRGNPDRLASLFVSS
jgi:hypothetical protein